MTYTEAFYKGFDAANRNVPLVAVKMTATYTLGIGFIIVLIVPVVVAVLAFGTGMFAALKDFNIDNIFQLLFTRYLILAIVLAAIVLLYILFATLAVIYIYGAECGMIARGMKEEDSFKFTIQGFISEGNRYFGPVLVFTSVVGIAALIVLLILAASAFPLGYIINTLEGTSRQLSTFMAILSVMAAAAIFLFMFAGMFAVTFYGTAMMIFKGTPATRAFNEAVGFIFRRPSAFWFYMLCAVVYFAANIMIACGMVAVAMIPAIGAVLAIPYQLLVQAVQAYMSILFIAVLFSYYVGAEGEGNAATSGMSTAATDTSFAAPAPETPLPRQADQGEGVH